MLNQGNVCWLGVIGAEGETGAGNGVDDSTSVIPYIASKRWMTTLTWQRPWRSALRGPRGVRIWFMMFLAIRVLKIDRTTRIIRERADTLGHGPRKILLLTKRVEFVTRLVTFTAQGP